MTSDLLSILNGLHDRHADFVIVGGVAAALHGGSRVTFDLDIVPSLDAESWVATVDLLVSLGAEPRIPEPLERIRDVTRIRTWRAEKGMLALSFRSPDGSVEVDLLVGESDDLDRLRERADKVVLEGRIFWVSSIEDLIAMKRRAGRPQDLLDISELEMIRARRQG
jgi:predicted nucleotidyltransferase